MQRNQVAIDERPSSSKRSIHEHDSENEILQERPIKKATRKHEDEIHGELSDKTHAVEDEQKRATYMSNWAV
jgi:hypothetical protein